MLTNCIIDMAIFCYYNNYMEIEFDLAKSEKNRLERNLPFEMGADFDWTGASYAEDVRNPYPERRFVAVGYLGGQVACALFHSGARRGPDYQFSQGKRQGGS